MRSAHYHLINPTPLPPLQIHIPLPESSSPNLRTSHASPNHHHHPLRNPLHSRDNLQPQRPVPPHPVPRILRLRHPAPRSGAANMRHETHRLLPFSPRARRALPTRDVHRCRARLLAHGASVVRDYDTVAAEAAGAACGGRKGCVSI